MFLWFLILVLGGSNAANCPDCPDGGIWSEWSSTDDCGTTCGACSSLNYTRTCLSDELPNCPCKGETKIIKLCNTQACNYPRANGPGLPCCVGSPTVVNNWYHCVSPTSSPTAPAATPCCPTGGIWGEWSGWKKQGTYIGWSRSRSCLSAGFQCACVGDFEETKYECPCPAQTMISPKEACQGPLTNKEAYNRDPVYYGSTCQSILALDISNFRFIFQYLDPKNPSRYVTDIGYIDGGGVCKITTIAIGGTTDKNGQYYYYPFTCNEDTGEWYMTLADGKNLTGIRSVSQLFTRY